MTKTFSIAQQIEEVQYELTMRSRVYPRLVARGKLRVSEAEYHTDRMSAVLATLKQLEEKADD